MLHKPEWDSLLRYETKGTRSSRSDVSKGTLRQGPGTALSQPRQPEWRIKHESLMLSSEFQKSRGDKDSEAGQ